MSRTKFVSRKTSCQLVAFGLVAVALLCSPAWSRADDSAPKPEKKKALPRVLVIGDSISIGYYPPVKELLKGKAEVVHVRGNSGNTGRTLHRLNRYFEKRNGRWDVVVFNCGLWDLCYWGKRAKARCRDKEHGRITTPIGEYDKNLRMLVKRLKEKTDAKLIWIATTPVPEGEPGRKVGDAVKYNAVAAKIMKENNIPIIDLHAHILPKMKDLQTSPGNVHFKKAGYCYLAKKVVEGISAEINKKATKP